MRVLWVILAAVLVCGGWGALAAEDAAAGGVEGAARGRLMEIVELVGRGDAAAVGAKAREAFVPEPVGMPAGDVVRLVVELHDLTRGLEVEAVEPGGAGEVTGRVKSKLTGEWGGLRVKVEAAPPHRVVWFGRGKTPEAKVKAAPARRMSDDQIGEAVGAYVSKLAEADAFSGVVLVARGGRPIFLRAYGEAEKNWRVPNAADTRFNIGSMTKMFTAVAVLQLVERGKVSLDDPLSKFAADVPDAESAGRITIRQLLTHTSGLGDHVPALMKDAYKTRFRSVDKLLELVRGVTPVFEPGSKWRYSNSGFLALGKVVEAASGENYYDYVRRNVFGPAGMRDTDYYELDRVNERLAVGYQREVHEGRAYWRNNSFDVFVRGGPEGGVYSTAEDVLRFERALRGGKLLGAVMAREAMSAHPEIKSPEYGYGFQVEEGGRVVGHGGGFVGVQTKLDMYGGDGGEYATIVLSNYGGRARAIVMRMRELLLAAPEVGETAAGVVK